MVAILSCIYRYYNFDHRSFTTGDLCFSYGWELLLPESLQPAVAMVAEISLGFLLWDRVLSSDM